MSVVSSSEGWWVLPQGNSKRSSRGLRRDRFVPGIAGVAASPQPSLERLLRSCFKCRLRGKLK